MTSSIAASAWTSTWWSDVIRQAHTVSRIASEKRIGVQRAYLFSAIALLVWLLVVLLARR